MNGEFCAKFYGTDPVQFSSAKNCSYFISLYRYLGFWVIWHKIVQKNKETGCGDVDKNYLAQNTIQSHAVVTILNEKWGMSWYVKQLLASQEEICSMESVNIQLCKLLLQNVIKIL